MPVLLLQSHSLMPGVPSSFGTIGNLFVCVRALGVFLNVRELRVDL